MIFPGDNVTRYEDQPAIDAVSTKREAIFKSQMVKGRRERRTITAKKTYRIGDGM